MWPSCVVTDSGATEECLRACTNPLTGKPVIATIRRPGASDPLALHATDADMIITWANGPLGFDHPAYGLIGPLPVRRPGGHTGRYGAAYINGPGIPARDGVVTSAFNVVPTAIALSGRPLPADLSGADLGVAVAS